MQISKELAQLIIQNMDIIESAPEVVEKIEKKLFEAIDQKIQERIEKEEGWKGTFEWDNDGTRFSPLNWPKNDNNEDYCWYGLYSTNDDIWTLSVATGVNGEELCFSFDLTQNAYSKNIRTVKSEQRNLLENNAELKKHGFIFNDKIHSCVYRPFHFDANKLAEEYPDFDEALKPLDNALEDLFAAHPIFDAYVKKLEKEKIKDA